VVTKNVVKKSAQLLDNKRIACHNGIIPDVSPKAHPALNRSHTNSPSVEQIPDGPHVQLDKVALHVIWRETHNRVEVLRARVREGSDVMAASEFSRWLQFSGILRILPEQPFPLPCHGKALSREVELLVTECGEWFANHERSNVQPHPQIPRTELERINAQLASLTAAVANLTPPNIETASAVNASLRVIEGGVK